MSEISAIGSQPESMSMINRIRFAGKSAIESLKGVYGHSKSALPTYLSAGVAGAAAIGGVLAQSAQAANNKLMSPEQASRMIVHDYENTYQFGFVPDPKNETVKPHHLVINGTCNPNNPSDPNAKTIIDKNSAQVVTTCTVRNGHYYSQTFPRRYMAYPNQNNYVSLLKRIGDDAAQSAHINPNQYSNADYAHVAKKTELDVIYPDNATSSTSPKQLKELRFKIVSGHETVQKVWYK